ncbi:hypothetical protein O181_012384 [Austropuccinia psidii MF-1]|uniref:Uncharacterized protein n=1 Tax=Austropuccinia psidii MF-1 TaxID=1389203 RepID=A0A9Q3BWB5_9BASI|nr:hypothetical protein [Austropuccinia psidii MF-1]
MLHFLHVPHLKKTLIGLGEICRYGFEFFRKTSVNFEDKRDDQIPITVQLKNNLSHLRLSILYPSRNELSTSRISNDIVHARSVNPGKEILKEMYPDIKKIPFSDTGTLGKYHRLSYSGKLPRAPPLGNTAHSSLPDRIPPSSLGYSSYYRKVTDDHSRCKPTYIL